MPYRNTDDSYGIVSIILHWLMAIMVMIMIVVGFFMADMEDSATKLQILGIHKATGVMVLLLALFRWYWMLTNAKPKPMGNWSIAETAMAHASKWLLMLMLLILPISGVLQTLANGNSISIYDWFVIPAWSEKSELITSIAHAIHEYAAIIIALVVIMHILAGLKHHLIKKDNTLNRILGQ